MAVDYKDLVVWQRAVDLVTAIYSVSRSFPPDERFGLTNQIRRAAVSIPSNIAEGQGRRSKIDFKRFLCIANGSRQEVETQLLIAVNLGFLKPQNASEVGVQLAEIGRLLSGLMNALPTKRS